MSIQKITFQGVLDYLATKAGTRWNMVFQASQFETNDFGDQVNFGLLTLNLSPNATRDMTLFDDHIYFKIRKHGIVQEMQIPYTALMIIHDPDDASQSLPWPYFMEELEHDYVESEDNVVIDIPTKDNVVKFVVPKEVAKNYLDIPANVIPFPGGTAHVGDVIQMDKAKVMANDDFTGGKPRGAVNHLMLDEATFLANPTVQQRTTQRKWRVIDGGKVKPQASMPVIDEIYRAKRERREQERLLAKINLSGESGQVDNGIRSDGSKGKSVFFPDLDVSKCYFPTKRIERPSWMTVIDGGKPVNV